VDYREKKGSFSPLTKENFSSYLGNIIPYHLSPLKFLRDYGLFTSRYSRYSCATKFPLQAAHLVKAMGYLLSHF
jgi:hypothetical protein